MADQRRDHQALQAEFTEIKVRLGVTDAALQGFFAILEQQVVPPEQWPERLFEIARRHKQALERLAALEPEDPAIRDLLHQARAAIETGNYDQAEQLLDQAEARESAAIERAGQLLQEAQVALERRRLSAAAIRAEQAELLLIQLCYGEAAAQFAAAAEQTPASRPDTRRGYRERQAYALYHQGDERGDNPALAEAIRIYRDLLAAYSRQREPLAWARTQVNLGVALVTLGERESDSEWLHAALAAYRAALQELTRERTPLDWARTQNNLGNILAILGQRESDSERLHEALAAYRAALQEYSRERTPLDWATTQHNLGTVLAILGEQESDSERLEAARGHIQQAWRVFQDAGLDQYDQSFRRRLERLDRLLEAE